MKKFLLFSCLFLNACTCKTDYVVIDEPVLHPQLPSSLSAPIVDITPVEHNGISYFEINKENFILLNKYLLDISEYIEKQKAVVCFYRKDLNESYCSEKSDNSKKD